MAASARRRRVEDVSTLDTTGESNNVARSNKRQRTKIKENESSDNDEENRNRNNVVEEDNFNDDDGEGDDDSSMEGEDEEDEEDDDEEEEAGVAENNNNNNNNNNNKKKSGCSTTQQKAKKKINKENQQAEAGIIETVYMENFMCHKKYTVQLCRNVNFIHGQNGSGKSAILAAIQICLGAGARRTHRARNLKELVRKEATGDNSTSASARIRVTVLNTGPDAFKHDVYGDSIIVERNISLRGGGYNGYKLLSKDKVEQSRSKKELDQMLDHLNIQVENPVAILDQEDAKKFLLGKPEDKYAFFMKATELERIDRIYASTKDHVEELNISKEKLCNSLQQTKATVQHLKDKYDQHAKLQQLEVKVMELNANYAWAFFNVCNREHAQALEHMEKFNRKADKKKQELTQAETQANTPGDEEQAKRDRLDTLIQEAEDQTHMKRDLEAELKRAQAPQKHMINQRKQLKREQAHAQNALIKAKQYLQQARDQILEKAGSAESEQARCTTLLKKTEEELEKAKEKSNHLKQAVSTALRSYEELEPYIEQARHNVQTKRSQLDAVQKQLQEIQQTSSNNNSIAIFGQRCHLVRQMVDDATQKRLFRGEVVGPIGSFIKVVEGKKEFAKIAEYAIGGGVLDRFIVTNDHDREIFQQIRRRAHCGQDCGVFQMRNAPQYNIPPPPAEGIETVASTLSITHPLVFNCLVDHARIDQKALAPNKEHSEQQLLVLKPNGKYVMRVNNIKEVFFLPDGDRWSIRNGAPAIAANEKKMRQSIGIDLSAALEETQSELEYLQNEFELLRQDESKAELEHTKYQKQWNQEKRAMAQNNKLIQTLQGKIDEVKTEMETIGDVEIDTTELEEDVTRAEQEVEEKKEEDCKLKEDIENLEPQIEDVQNRLDEVTMRNEKVLEDIQIAEEDLGNYLQKLTQNQEILEKKRQKLQQLEEIMTKHQEKLSELERDRSKALLSARTLTYNMISGQKREEQEQEAGGDEAINATSTNLSPMEPTDEDLEEIEIPTHVDKEPSHYETRLNRAKRKVEDERKRRMLSNEDPSVAYEKYTRAKNDLDGKIRKIDEITNSVHKLISDMKARKKLWRRFRKYLSLTTDLKFDQMLHLNKSAGEIEFNHEENKLNLIVQKDEKSDSTQTKDVKALSGGERSFTTMCLLLALGEQLETPFRILDEFDVFLDTQVRKLTINALIHVAKKLKHRQFIFITPQDLSSITPDNMLKILRVKAPIRNQMAGGPSQSTIDFPSSQQE